MQRRRNGVLITIILHRTNYIKSFMDSISDALERVIVLDDFYPDPDVIRQTALTKDYHSPPENSGRLAKTAFCNEHETAALCQLLQHLITERDIVNVSVLFRYTLANTTKKVFCHVDGCSYAGIVYLTLPEHCAGGTTLYRHKPTGDIFYNSANSDRYNFQSADQWETLKQIDMAYNRLVLYPGQIFHAISPVFFGDDITNARLTQNMFVYRPGDMALKEYQNAN